MNLLPLFTSTQGRLGRKPFALCLLAIYVLGFLSQLLLIPAIIARV